MAEETGPSSGPKYKRKELLTSIVGKWSDGLHWSAAAPSSKVQPAARRIPAAAVLLF
jgi:hypothetical protein